MKLATKTLAILLLLSFSLQGNAQIFKRLKDKLNSKVEQKVEQEIDKTIDNIGKKDPQKKEDFSKSKQDNIVTEGSAIIKHGTKYGTYNIENFGKAITSVRSQEVRIYGSWVTMSADIQDGYVLVIPNGQALLFDDDKPKQKQIKLSIPDEAQLQLSYDPVYDPEAKDENGFASAVTVDYQNYDLESGEVTIDVLSKNNLQISFSGSAKLVTRTLNPKQNRDEKYLLSYETSSVSGAIDVGPVDFQFRKKQEQAANKEVIEPEYASGPDTAKGLYKFTFETQVVMTNLTENESYNISYLLNPDEAYIAMKGDMGEYSDDELTGESLIVMDGDNIQIFVETQGMKMRMSQSMMGNQAMQNPAEQMANYDYTGLKKTGKSKAILGAKCYEYVMADNEVTMSFWVAPSVNLPNWFMNSSNALDGHIMEYTMDSKDGRMKIETIAIKDNIERTINPKDYKKMF